MSPLRFCFPTTFYPPFSFGGDGIAVQRLAQALVRRGHHVTVIHDADSFLALHRGPAPENPPRDDGVEVISLRSAAGILSPFLTQQLGRPTLQSRRLREILDDGKFDVINFHNASLVGGPGVFSYGKNALKLFTAHDHWLVCPSHDLWRHNRELCTHRECLRCQLNHHRPPQLWRLTSYMQRQIQEIDVFLAMSEFSRDKHREFGFPRDMEVLPQFLPDEVVCPAGSGDRPHERAYFFSAGRLEKIKGLDNIIPLFGEYGEADLVIAGDGSERDTLGRIAGASRGVRFVGRVDQAHLARYYANAIATIVPSAGFETFGLVLIESFQRRTPVIASRLGPFPEIVGACGGGELFGSKSELLAAMTRLQTDSAHRKRLADNARAGFEENWSEAAVIPRYFGIIERARAGSP